MLKLKPYSVSVEDAETKEQIPLTAIKGEQGLPGQPGRDGQDGQPGQDGYTPVKGVDYYTDAEKSALETEVQGVVESNIQGTLDDIQDKVDEAEAIAKGRSAGYVFDTEDAMTTWVAAHSDELNLGDNLYIRATDVPDYWWDGTLVQPLETQKVDLTEYAKTSTVNTELGKKQDKLTAGTNITISGTTISAKSDSTKQDKLTAGTNITISGTTISAKSDTTKQDKLVSGTNIKTVNGESLLGSGNIEIKGGGSGDGTVDSTVAIDVIPPSSDPEYINVQNELDGIKEDIAQLSSVLVDVHSSSREVEKEIAAEYRAYGKYMSANADMTKVGGEQSTNASKNTAKFHVDGGKKYRISCTYGENSRYAIGYAFTDSDKNLLAYKVREDGGTSIISGTYDVIAPSGSVYLYVNKVTVHGEANAVELVESSEKEYIPKSYYKNETYTKTEVEEKIDEKISDIQQKHKTCILFNFDAPPKFVSDGRKELLDKYRIPYTINITVNGATTATYPGISEGRNYIDEIIRDGNDFAIYSSSSTKPSEDASIYNGDEDAVKLFETYVKEAKECAERFGIFNPTAWFARFMRTGTAMNQALINCGFKICRGYKYGVTPAESTNSYVKDWNNHDKQMFNVNAQSIQSDGIEGTKARIDIAIENGWDLAPFAHGIYETQEEATAGNGITKEVFEAVLAYSRQKADEGLCELVTFRDYYRLKYPADGGANDIARERKYSDWKYGQNG